MNLATSAARRWIVLGVLGLSVAACGGSAAATSSPSSVRALPSSADTTVAPSQSVAASPSTAASAVPSGSQAPDTGGGTTAGDVPDNAVFLTLKSGQGFSIQYVEGWQVTTQPDGVLIHDKDSSETVKLVNLPTDMAAYITSTDLPSLQSQAGYKLIKQDAIKVGGATYQHLAYHVLSPADAVTGKQVPLTVDRYYVPGPSKLAIVSLSSPDGVDNVDAFRQMIASFRWQ